jgi:L-2-hydroxyglutarate oxidase LhgO
MTIGTDVNFGELTRNIFTYLANLEGVTMHFNCEVQNLKQREELWRIKSLIGNWNKNIQIRIYRLQVVVLYLC